MAPTGVVVKNVYIFGDFYRSLLSRHGMPKRLFEYLTQNLKLLRDIVGWDRSGVLVGGDNYRFIDMFLPGYS